MEGPLLPARLPIPPCHSHTPFRHCRARPGNPGRKHGASCWMPGSSPGMTGRGRDRNGLLFITSTHNAAALPSPFLRHCRARPGNPGRKHGASRWMPGSSPGMTGQGEEAFQQAQRLPEISATPEVFADGLSREVIVRKLIIWLSGSLLYRVKEEIRFPPRLPRPCRSGGEYEWG